jgi:hypothetical protein
MARAAGRDLVIRGALLAAALALPALSPVLAQEAPAIDPALAAAAEAYVAGEAQQALIDQLISPAAILAQINAAIPNLPPQLTETVSQVAAEEMATLRPKIEAAMLQSAARTFSLDEIRALTAFYGTPEGRGILLKMQPFLEGAMAQVAPDIQAAQGVILQRTFDALRGAQ